MSADLEALQYARVEHQGKRFLLRTEAQREALGTYFYENNRVGTVLFDSPDFVVYRLEHDKLFRSGGRAA